LQREPSRVCVNDRDIQSYCFIHRYGWRLHGGASRRFDVELAGERHTWRLVRRHDATTLLQVGDRHWSLTAQALGDGRHDVNLDGLRRTLSVYSQGERCAVFADAGSALITEVDPIAHAGDHAGEAGRLTAPMPGKVVAFMVAAGERVRSGQALAVMEAMKMEHTIHAPRDGVVDELLYAAGDQVSEGGELLRLVASPPP
jgi:3-methylcrotonyl-CoA carboxylase alpha subunit